MPQAAVTGSIVSGGGAVQGGNAQAQARQLAIIGCSPGGTVNTLLQPSSQPGAQSALGQGGLLEEAALVLAVPGVRPPPILVPATQTSVGAVSAAGGSAGLMLANALNQGTGTLTMVVVPNKAIKVKVTLGGTLGTAKVKVSIDGGTTYGAEQTTAAGWSSTGYAVPNTYVTIKMGAATYVLNDFATIGVDGTITDFASAGALTFVASPIDQYELLATVIKGGSYSSGAVALQVSLDNGFSIAGVFQMPTTGVIVLTDGRGGNIGIKITGASTFTAGDTYTGQALPPAPSSSDVVAAIAAMQADPNRPTVCCIHVQAMPTSAANAMTLASAVQAQLDSAFAAGLDWQATIECPSSVSADIVMSGGVPVADSADTDSVVRAARSGITCNRVAVCCSSGGIVSPITGIRTRRPFGWAVAQRYAATDPANSLGRPADGPLNFTIGRDEKLASIQLGDVQFNVPTTYDAYQGGAYLNITSGGFALKNLTIDAKYQDAESLRAMNIVSAAVRVQGIAVLADRPPVNADNTIAETPARDYDTIFDGAVKRAVGLLAGGAFGNVKQVTIAGAAILRTSVLGASPRRLDVAVTFKGLGMISAVTYTIAVQGA